MQKSIYKDRLGCGGYLTDVALQHQDRWTRVCWRSPLLSVWSFPPFGPMQPPVGGARGRGVEGRCRARGRGRSPSSLPDQPAVRPGLGTASFPTAAALEHLGRSRLQTRVLSQGNRRVPVLAASPLSPPADGSVFGGAAVGSVHMWATQKKVRVRG